MTRALLRALSAWLVAGLAVLVLPPPATGRPQRDRFRDPESVARFINEATDGADLVTLWDAFGVKVPNEYSGCTCDPRACGSCSAKIVMPSQPLSDSRVCAVRVSFLDDTSTYYLVFFRDGGWRYAYCIQSPHNKYDPVAERFERAGTTCWLVLNEFWGGGSGGLR